MNATPSTYPPPPDYYSQFNPSKDGDDAAAAPMAPPAPLEGEITTFGVNTNSKVVIPPLLGANRLNEQDLKASLEQLNKELVNSVNELMSALQLNPSGHARELESVLAIQNNMLHACNLYRPIQARATMRHLLAQQIEQKEVLLAELKDRREKLQEAVVQSYSKLTDTSSESPA